MSNVVMKVKIEEYKVLKLFCLKINKIPISRFKPPLIKSLGLPNSIYIRGINKNIIPKNKYKQPK